SPRSLATRTVTSIGSSQRNSFWLAVKWSPSLVSAGLSAARLRTLATTAASPAPRITLNGRGRIAHAPEDKGGSHPIRFAPAPPYHPLRVIARGRRALGPT